jgi:hypothetical protein
MISAKKARLIQIESKIYVRSVLEDVENSIKKSAYDGHDDMTFEFDKTVFKSKEEINQIYEIINFLVELDYVVMYDNTSKIMHVRW